MTFRRIRLPEHLKDDQVPEYGKLWSFLELFGPSARETWNDSPSSGAGTTEPEIQAWFNLSAFVARLTKTGTEEFWLYAVWEFRDALEASATSRTGDDDAGVVDSSGVRIDLRTTLVWLKIAGKEMWEACNRGEQMNDIPIDNDSCSKDCPWYGCGELSRGQWNYWKSSFGVILVSKSDKWPNGAKKFAAEALRLMESIEGRSVLT